MQVNILHSTNTIMSAEQTKNPCNAEREVFFNDIKILLSSKK